MEETTPIVDAAPEVPEETPSAPEVTPGATEVTDGSTPSETVSAAALATEVADDDAVKKAKESITAFLQQVDPEKEVVKTEFKLFVAPIPRTTTEDILREAFKDIGEVVDCTVLKDKVGMNRGCAFLVYGSKEEADSAIETHHNKLILPGTHNDKAVEVQYAQSKGHKFRDEELADEGGPGNKMLFFARTHSSITDATIKATFEAFGEVETVNIFMDRRTGYCKGCGFVTMVTRDGAEKAKDALHMKYTFPSAFEKMSVKWADPDLQDKKKKRSADEMATSDNKQLFFGKAPKTATEEDIKKVFETYGAVQEVVLLKERSTSTSKGCGFVTMETKEQADSALNAFIGSKYIMEGGADPLVVKWAEHREKRPAHQGYGGYPAQQQPWGQPYDQQYAAYGAYQDPYAQYPGYNPYGQPYGAPPPYGQPDPYNQYPGYDAYYQQYHQHYAQQGYGAPPAQPGPGGPPRGPGGGGGGGGAPHKLYVGGIPHHIEEADLRPMFDTCGTITDIRVLKDRFTGVHRGAAFLTYSTKEEADKAIEQYHQKTTLPGNPRPIIVKFANKPQW